jgi:hypothetical protein
VRVEDAEHRRTAAVVLPDGEMVRTRVDRVLPLADRKVLGVSHGAFGIATVYAGLGDYDQAFAWLEKSVGEHTVRPYVMGPMFADLRRDPRFGRIRELLGL